MSIGPDATATEAVPMTVFVDWFAQTKREELVDLPALSRKLIATNARSKYKLPLLKLATFGDFRTSYDCPRSDANVSALTGIEADYDGERASFEGYPLPPAKFFHNGNPQPLVTKFDFGYALTVHKAQGSEWPRVALIDEHPAGDTRRRWLYTAITRASEGIVVSRRGG